jgi:hypothetical protein
MSVPSTEFLLSVARYIVDANAVHAASPDILTWAEPLVAAAAAAAAAAATATAPTNTVESSTKVKRKAKTTKTDPLLLPVESVSAMPEPAVVPSADDPLKNHKYRLQSINSGLCQARKRGDVVPGTNPKEDGYVKKFYIETQCSKPPVAGQPMCKTCAKMESEKSKYWQGRLDQPLAYNADVVGCGNFFEAYPGGLKNDPTTAPPTPAVLVNTKSGAKAKTKAVVATPKNTITETVAVTDSAVPEAEWEKMFFKGKPYIRNLKTQKIYEVDSNTSVIAEMARKDRCVGKWIAENGTIDPYAVDDDDDDEE